MDTYLIAGVDEVGRGAWAGPIVAAAVILRENIVGLKDSKKISPAKRKQLSDIIKIEAFAWSISQIEANEIDRIGLGEANRLVMRQALDQLDPKPQLVRTDGFSCRTDFTEEVYIKGDEHIPEISAASIIAKVYRDDLMHNLHIIDQRYGFDRHVGYGTKYHYQKLVENGPSKYHRYSFNPIKKLY